MMDLVEQLNEIKNHEMVGLDCAPIELDLLASTIAEIERLRATIAKLRVVAGAVSVEGHSYADIRASTKRMPVSEPGEPS